MEVKEPKVSEMCDDEDSKEIEEIEEISDDETENGINSSSMDKNTNLHFSAALGLLDNVIQDLESPDQTLDAENFMGWTSLMMAVRNGRIEVVKTLLERGADITKKNKFGMNIFALSVADGNVDMMEIILRHMLRGGISRNRIQENLSPISLAILFKKPQLVNWLIDQGFDLNAATSKTNLSPLMFAAAASSDTTVKMLEARGANKNHKNYMELNYRDMILWRNKGLHHLKKFVEVDQEPTVDTVLPMMVTSPKNSITKPHEHLLQPKTPQHQEIDADLNSSELNYRVPNNTLCVYHAAQEPSFPRQEGKISNITQIQPPIIDKKFTDPQIQLQYQYTPQGQHFSNQSMSTSGVQQNNTNQTPCNMHSSNYVRVMHSPYGVCNRSSPIMSLPQYQNFVAALGGLPQNSPMGLMPSPQNFYQAAPDSPIQQDMTQVPIENSENPNDFYNNTVFYYSFSPFRTMYPFRWPRNGNL